MKINIENIICELCEKTLRSLRENSRRDCKVSAKNGKKNN